MEQRFSKAGKNGLIKIAVTGPESSGKSMLTEALAKKFDTAYAPEYARVYLEKTGGTYGIADLNLICQGQIANEESAIAAAEKVCFFDTDMLVLKIWSQFRFGSVSKTIEEAFHSRNYDFFLLCRPDLPWTPDPFRESPVQEERELLFSIYERHLQSMGAAYFIVEGLNQSRIVKAFEAVLKHLG